MCYVLGHGIYNVTSSLVRGKFQSCGEIESMHEFEFLGENNEEMDKNIVDNSYSYFTFVCGNVLFYRDASFHGVYSIGYL